MSLLDALFPRFCCSCGWIGSLLCVRCYQLIEFQTSSEKTPYLASLQAVTQYGQVTQSLVHALKYKSVAEVGILCARIIFLAGKVPKVDLVSAIPLHPNRFHSRGFNQSEVIAKELSLLINKPYQPLLNRSINTKQLAKSHSKQTRKKEIENAFTVVSDSTIINKSVLLIDDVWTTGATLNAAGQALLTAKASAVHGLTFTHGL